jgi:hypothetical protein
MFVEPDQFNKCFFVAILDAFLWQLYNTPSLSIKFNGFQFCIVYHFLARFDIFVWQIGGFITSARTWICRKSVRLSLIHSSFFWILTGLTIWVGLTHFTHFDVLCLSWNYITSLIWNIWMYYFLPRSNCSNRKFVKTFYSNCSDHLFYKFTF